MNKDNKIISFDSYRNRQINTQEHTDKYSLKYTITIEIFKNDATYSFDYNYPKEISEDELFKILFDIYLKVARTTKKEKMPAKKLFNKSFSILYYTNNKNPKDFKIITTPNIDNAQLSAILWIMINNSS